MRWIVAIVLTAVGCNQGVERYGGESPLAIGELHVRHAAETGGRLPLDVNVTTNGNDMAYKTTLTVGDRDKLVVRPAGGAPAVEFMTNPIQAEYFHVGHLLIVTTGPEGDKSFNYFNDPASWSTVRR
ncbi:MAG: hypothetical protein HYY06_03630 [Deltaproteobacteria bacterium]|nr:hypothetical protein [Deltaproteobacteria bacterium]